MTQHLRTWLHLGESPRPSMQAPEAERELRAQGLERAARRWMRWAHRRRKYEPEDAQHARECAQRARWFAAELRGHGADAAVAFAHGVKTSGVAAPQAGQGSLLRMREAETDAEKDGGKGASVPSLS